MIDAPRAEASGVELQRRGYAPLDEPAGGNGDSGSSERRAAARKSEPTGCFRQVRGVLSTPAPCWLVAVFAALFAALVPPMLQLSDVSVSLWKGGDGGSACTPAHAGAIYFSTAQKSFVGCDGSGWNRLAFCCAPSRPDPPSIALAHPPGGGDGGGGGGEGAECEIRLSWRSPAANGSPVTDFSLQVGLVERTSSTVYRGPELTACVGGLNASVSQWFSVRAHAAGGTSEPSRAVELQPAPSPLSFRVDDDGDCELGPADEMRIAFDRPTDCAATLGASGGGGSGCAANATLTPAQLRRLLGFSYPIGVPLSGHWRAPDLLVLRMADAHARTVDDVFPQLCGVSLRRSGGLVVAPPALSLAAGGESPPLAVSNCLLEGFEGARGASIGPAWFLEGDDVGAYTVAADERVKRSGRQSLRLRGGSAGGFDGLRSVLPPGSRPRRLSFWLRSETAANVGYLTLGGASIKESILYFHLKPDGTAGLLSSTGAWEGGPYEARTWLHVRIDINWGFRTTKLWLDGEAVATDVSFASADAQAGPRPPPPPSPSPRPTPSSRPRNPGPRPALARPPTACTSSTSTRAPSGLTTSRSRAGRCRRPHRLSDPTTRDTSTPTPIAPHASSHRAHDHARASHS